MKIQFDGTYKLKRIKIVRESFLTIRLAGRIVSGVAKVETIIFQFQ